MQAEEEGRAPSHGDVEIITEVIQGNFKRLSLGFLALERGTSPEVVHLGVDMIDTAVQANKELTILANNLNLYVAQEEALALFARRMEELRRAAKGSVFDRAFVRECMMMDDPPPPAEVRDERLKRVVLKLHRMMGVHFRRTRAVGAALGMSETELQKRPAVVGEELPAESTPPSPTPAPYPRAPLGM